MKVAIATERAPKVEGVRLAIESNPYTAKIAAQIEYILHPTESGVSAMPMSLEETMKGARNRVANLRESLGHLEVYPNLYIGLEGGVSMVGETGFLFGAAYIENGQGEGHFGFSQMLEVPQKILKELKAGAELGPLMQKYSAEDDLRSKQGAMFAWSDGMFARTDEFALACKTALAPLYNEYYK